MRSAVTSALVGFRNHANPVLSCNILSSKMQDPFLFVMVSALRTLRRMFNINPTLAKEIVSRASAFTGKITCGPATNVSRYLRSVNLQIHEDGSICSEEVRLCNVFTDCTKAVKKSMTIGDSTHLPTWLIGEASQMTSNITLK